MSKITNLNDKREPVTYVLTITHHWDGTLEAFVENVSDSQRSQDAVWSALKKLVAQHFSDDTLKQGIAMSEWQPIETAPKDGSEFLTIIPAEEGKHGPLYDTAYWSEEFEDFIQHGCGFEFVTHWMPLPEPPK